MKLVIVSEKINVYGIKDSEQGKVQFKIRVNPYIPLGKWLLKKLLK